MKDLITQETLFDKSLEEIRHQKRELFVQEKAQSMINKLIKACTSAGMGDVSPDKFANTTLGEFAIIAARNSIKIEATFDDSLEDSSVLRYC